MPGLGRRSEQKLMAPADPTANIKYSILEMEPSEVATS